MGCDVSMGERIVMVRKKGSVDRWEFFVIHWTLANEGNMSILNASDHSPNNATSYPRKPESSIMPL
jgi:hypothetical protein